MKLKLLTATLLTSLALTACQNEPAADTTAAMPAPTASPADTAMASPSDAPDMAEADASAQAANPMVGGAPMFADRDIVTNAATSQDHTTLVAAVQAAGLVDTLKGPGPFTVFAPTNAAFEKLPAGAVDGLLKPEMKDDLTQVLTYHVVPGNVDAAALTQQIQAGGGSAMLKTVAGAELTAKADGGTVTLTDAKGNVATVTTADVRQSNGVIHVIDTVLMP